MSIRAAFQPKRPLTMTIPSLDQAQELLADAEMRNPGPWVAHSINVARAAELIAARHPSWTPNGPTSWGCSTTSDAAQEEQVCAM